MQEEPPTPVPAARECEASPHAAADVAFDLLYTELRSLACRHLANERNGHTLQPTALVNEAYLRLLRSEHPPSGKPEELYRSAALAMRHILIDHARKKGRVRRGGKGSRRLSLDAVQLASTGNLDDILAVDEAIGRLHEQDPEVAEIIRLRFYIGLSAKEIAQTLGRSERTVYREWSYAKAWLYRNLAPDAP